MQVGLTLDRLGLQPLQAAGRGDDLDAGLGGEVGNTLDRWFGRQVECLGLRLSNGGKHEPRRGRAGK